MYNSQRELVDALEATPQILRNLVRHLSAEQARTPHADSASDEAWSVVEIVCHLRDTEEVMSRRMRLLRDEENPRISGFDQEALAVEKDYAGSDLHKAVDAYARFRAEHVANLRDLSDEQWQRSGHHGLPGPVSIFNHTVHDVYHDAVHLAQIARQVETSSQS